MYFLYLTKKISDTDYIIEGIHNDPFGENGMGKTEEELKSYGFIVESLPLANDTKWTSPVLHINPQTYELWYTYEEMNYGRDLQIENLKQENTQLKEQLALQDSAILDLADIVSRLSSGGVV